MVLIKKKFNEKILLIILLILTAGAFFVAFIAGSSGLSLAALWDLLTGRQAAPNAKIIFFDIRLPRALFAYLAGGALAVAGACLQGMFKNPMADSYILGVSSGAGFGAALAISLGLGLSPLLGNFAIAIFAFLGALISVLTVYALSRYRGVLSTVSLILSGIAVSALLSAFVYLIMIMNRDKMEHIIMWTMGSFTSASWDKLQISAPVIVVCSILCMLFSRDLNIMLQGDEEASHLGVDTRRVRSTLLILTTLLSSAVVSFCGIIGFVGLMAPHTLRLIIGPDHKKLLPYSFLGGGVFLLLCDTLARVILAMQEMPVGVITAAFGAPYFIYLMRRNRKGGAL
jgi:iron complex transport system permease protein